MLKDITLEQVVQGLEFVLEQAKEAMGVEAEIDENVRPLAIYKSEVLVTLIGRLQDVLDITIPDNCYPFFDKESFEQLTVKQAAEIILNRATNGRENK